MFYMEKCKETYIINGECDRKALFNAIYDFRYLLLFLDIHLTQSL